MNLRTRLIFWGIMFTIPLGLVINSQSKAYSKENSVAVSYMAAQLENSVSSDASASLSEKLPFNRGVNLTNWLQSSNVRQIQFSKFTKQDFINIKSLGCDVIRLPINLHSMTSGEPNYTIDPLFYFFLDKIIDWAEELKLHLILDNHSAHISKETRRFLTSIPQRFEFVFTPKHGSWLNIIESLFAKMAKTLLRAIRVHTKNELKERLQQWLQEINESPVIFRWKYGLDSISLR